MTCRQMAQQLGIKELHRTELAMWRELERHQKNHGCTNSTCPVQSLLIQAWIEARQWRAAYQWLLGIVDLAGLPYDCASLWEGIVGQRQDVLETRARIAAKAAAGAAATPVKEAA